MNYSIEGLTSEPQSRASGTVLIDQAGAVAFEFFDDEQDAVNSFFADRKLKRFDILTFVQQEAG